MYRIVIVGVLVGCGSDAPPPREPAPPAVQEVSQPTPDGTRKHLQPSMIEKYRIAGSLDITPPDDVKQEMPSPGRIMAGFRFCLAETGELGEVEMIRSSGFPAYDAKIMSAIQKTWRYRPYQEDGVAIAVCTAIDIVYSQKRP